MQILKNIYTHFSHLILPKKCAACEIIIESDSLLCGPCYREIKIISEPHCNLCGTPFEFNVEGITECAVCMAEPPIYNKARALFVYDEKSSKIVTGFKYSDKTHVSDDLAKMFVNFNKEIFDEVDFIISVPMHPLRLVKRRYNQAALLANSVAKIAKKKVFHDILIRTKNTPPQASLSKKERKRNLAGAFEIKKKHLSFLKGKKVLIIDDVITTGSTVNACAKILKKAGAAKVFVLSIAKTLEK